MYKNDKDIAKEFEGLKITRVELATKCSGYITVEFPNGEDHVGGGATEVFDHFINYNDGRVAFDNWYPDNVYDKLVVAVNKIIK